MLNHTAAAPFQAVGKAEMSRAHHSNLGSTADSNRVFQVVSWLMGHVPFALKLRVTIFGEPE